MARKKLFETELIIDDISFPNFGTGIVDDKKIKVKHTIPGQKVLVRVAKRRRFNEGTIIKRLEKASYEIEPKCPDFLKCGGCTFQNLDYEDELRLKKQMVLKIFNENNIKLPKDLSIVKAPFIEGYRNKMEFSFGDEEKEGELALGMRKVNSFYEVVTSRYCNIIDNDYKKILLATLNFFQHTNEKFHHKRSKEGSLRHLVVRKGEFTNEFFVNIVTTDGIKADVTKWANTLTDLKLDNKIVGIAHSINNSIADIVQADEYTNLFGKDFFMEKLLGLDFKITPFSFFQTNSAGAEKLYSVVKDFLGNSIDKTIFDLYCGTGTIAQLVSENAKKVIGVEIVPEAIVAAKENAKLNNITNCDFVTGDVLKIIDDINDKPDIIIIDPPRSGIHPKAIGKIIDFNAKKIIYVSCKPTSLATDLKVFFENGYMLEDIKCVDMFPRTYHVETVVLMSKVDK